MDAPFDTPRRTRRPIDATTTLENVAIVTFDVDPGALASLLPRGLEPETRRLADGRERAFLSAVAFRDIDFRFAGAPWMPRSFDQTNYRAYVRAAGRSAVWFFGTTLDSRWVAVPRTLWRMPWHPGRTTLRATWTETGCTSWAMTCDGPWGQADVDLTGTGEPATVLDGFATADEAARVLTHPLRGYFRRLDGRIGRYDVWHERMRPELGTSRRARFAVFERLGLVAPDAAPHSVLLQRSIEFDVLLPPRIVAEPVSG